MCVWSLVAASGVAQSRLRAMEQDVVSGKFQKVGSVLMEQDGRVLYEQYFDGNANTLRDTRSATKTITSLLTGIAIGEHKLKEVDAPVLPFFLRG